jgi:exodeoxyribonuclease VII small subunit
MTYQEAYQQLTILVDDIEADQVPLDELPNTIKQATELIAFCQQRLRAVETDYQQAVQQLQKKQ